MGQDSNQIIKEANALFEEVMKVYWVYLDELEKMIAAADPQNEQMIHVLNQQIEEIQQAIIHDIDVFEKAAEKDIESVHQIKDQLKMNEIYKQLNNEV